MIWAPTGQEAWVETSADNGRSWTRSPEYSSKHDQSEHTDCMSCYIEARTGDRFRMVFADRESRIDYLENLTLEVVFSCDGEVADSIFSEGIGVEDQYGEAEEVSPIICSGLCAGPKEVLPFTYQLLKTTDEETSLTEESIRQLGELKIQLWRVSEPVPDESVDDEVYHDAPDADQKYDEKLAKKQSSHKVAFGEAEEGEEMREVVAERLHKEPRLEFKFKYRSAALLDILGIRPMPESSPAPSSSFASTSTPASSARTTRTSTHTTASNQRPNPRRAREESADSDIELVADNSQSAPRRKAPVRTVKRERMQSHGLAPGTVIDITTDDEEEGSFTATPIAAPRNKRVKTEPTAAFIDLT